MEIQAPTVLLEGTGWLVLDKPAGPSTHSDPEGGDMISLLRRFIAGGEPVAVHRLDAATSGCLLVATDKPALRHLAGAFARREIRKHYLAVVHGCPHPMEGEIFTHLAGSAPDNGRMCVVEPGAGAIALTLFRVLATSEIRSLVLAEPLTGRTHQLRAHFRHLGHPIVGDPLYGRPGQEAAPRMLLHAWRLSFPAPEGGRIDVESPLPPGFEEWPREAIGHAT